MFRRPVPAARGAPRPWLLSRNGDPLGHHDTQQGAISTGDLLCRNRFKLLGRTAVMHINDRDGLPMTPRRYDAQNVEASR